VLVAGVAPDLEFFGSQGCGTGTDETRSLPAVGPPSAGSAKPALLPSPPVVTTEPVRAIVFDLDDTLIVEEATAHASLRAAAAAAPHLGLDPHGLERTVLAEARRRWQAGPHYELCAELGFASWEGLWSTFEGGHPRLEGLRQWAPSYRRATWQSALAELGADDPGAADACAESFAAHQRRGHPLVDGADTTVRTLADRYDIGLLTNGPPDVQQCKIDATGLEDCFAAVVISGVVGVAKPDPAVFDLVLDRLAANRASTVMVGDNWERDVRGARAAGWSSIWVSAGRPCPDPSAGVPAVDGVAEILPLLG
jgi:phosphoserine phosphatase